MIPWGGGGPGGGVGPPPETETSAAHGICAELSPDSIMQALDPFTIRNHPSSPYPVFHEFLTSQYAFPSASPKPKMATA